MRIYHPKRYLIPQAPTSPNNAANLTLSPLIRRPMYSSISKAITNQRINPMARCTEAPQLHLLPVLNLLCVAVTPFHGHLGVCVRVDQNVERAVPVEDGQESCRRGDLPEYSLDFVLDLFFGLGGGEFGCAV